ncbi:hypothetical protein [Pseudomonas sp. Xaverov 259]|uniref:hypothetical protein n=1 Tax=Pseudomonas sp. Xaverov 259 TaxID=2666086 RepID=UPI001C5A9530|nr:hypothetical protein [Pseudomonas sp. Xaverov 259]
MTTRLSDLFRAILRLRLKRCDRPSAKASLDPAESELQISRIIGKISGNELANSEPLHSRDLQLIAELIQIYNFIEFNLRRCIELFTHVGLIEKSEKTIPMAHLSRVALGAISRVEGGGPWESHLQEIELHRERRNDLAHWAARRIIGEDALLILTMNPAETKKRIAQPADHMHSAHGVMLLKDLEWLVQRLSQYDRMLAEATSLWHIRYTEG